MVGTGTEINMCDKCDLPMNCSAVIDNPQADESVFNFVILSVSL